MIKFGIHSSCILLVGLIGEFSLIFILYGCFLALYFDNNGANGSHWNWIFDYLKVPLQTAKNVWPRRAQLPGDKLISRSIVLTSKLLKMMIPYVEYPVCLLFGKSSDLAASRLRQRAVVFGKLGWTWDAHLDCRYSDGCKDNRQLRVNRNASNKHKKEFGFET